MTTQMQVGVTPERKSNTTTNMAIGAGVGAVAGAGYGATIGAPAKYSSFAELVEEAAKGDEFKLATVPEGASDEVKNAFTTVKDSIDKTKETLKNVAETFKPAEGATEAVTKEISEVAELVKVANAPADEAALKTLKQNTAVAEMFSKIAKDGEISITDEMKNVFKNGEAAGTDDQVKAAFKTITSQDWADKAKMTEDQLNAVNNYISGNKDALALAEAATVKDGKLMYTEAAVTDYVKKGSQDAQEAVGKLGKLLGTNKVGGAIKWGAIGLVVAGAAAWLYSKFFGNKEAA